MFDSNNRVQIFHGDQSNPTFLEHVMNSIDTDLDVIIDDGSHVYYHQQVSLITLFKKVKSGGLYIIEDFHYTPYVIPKTLHTRDLLLNLDQFKLCSYLNQNDVDHFIDSVDNMRWFDSA